MKMLKRIAAIGAVIIIIFLLIDCSMQKVAERDEGYTQSNLWAYYLYTDRDIRRAPRASESYHFTFTAQDGSQPQESSIVYSTDAPLVEVKNYLASLGYRAVEHNGLSEKWEKEGNVAPYFYISHDSKSHSLTLSKVDFR
ncbi:hypothetical protein IFU25_18920 [Pantoea agglomerans]|nr:hypothetical protein [Pantoea agglomerans]